MNLLRPTSESESEERTQTVSESLPEEGFGMEWDIIYDEQIRMSEENLDQNPYIFIPHSEEVGSGEAFEDEGSGDNEEGYDGDLQYEETSEVLLDYSGDGLILEEGSTEVELGQRRMDYDSDYESPNDVEDLPSLIDEAGSVDYIEYQLEPALSDLVEEEAHSFEMMEMEEGKKRKLMDDEYYQTRFGDIAHLTESGENEEDLNQIVENLDTIEGMDLDTIENLDTIESMLTSILGNINLVSQQQYDVQYQTQFDLLENGEKTGDTVDHLKTASTPVISNNTEYDEVEEQIPVNVVSESHVQQQKAGFDLKHESEQEAEPESEIEAEPEHQHESEPEPEAESEPEFEAESKLQTHLSTEPKAQQKDKRMPDANVQEEKYDPNHEQVVHPNLEPQAEPEPHQRDQQDDPQLRAQEEVHLEAHLKQTSKLEIQDEQEGRPQHALTLGPRPHLQEALEHKNEFGTESSEVIVNDLNYINNGELGEKEPHNAPVVGTEAATIGEISAKNGVERETPGEISAEDNVQMFAMSENGVDRNGKEVDMATDGDESLQRKQDNLEGQYKEAADEMEQQSISEKDTVVYYGANKKPRQAGNEAMVRDATKDPAKDEGNRAAKEATIANTLGIGRTDEDRTSDKVPQKMAMTDKKGNEYESTDVNFVSKSGEDKLIASKEADETRRKDGMFFLPAGHGLFFGFKLGEMEKHDKVRLEIFANNQIHTDIDSSTIELAL